ncbi:MAG: hypothetical protein IIC66_06490, partial [candidate division Zixibacteria bacterium]|nr:hypothetical protein [candidate division Zixibacteria bacterium]
MLNQNNLDAISVSGLEGSSPAILVSSLANLANIQKGPILVVTQSSAEALDFYEDIIAITGSEKVGLFPSRQILPYDFRPPVGEIIGIRISTLAGIL